MKKLILILSVIFLSFTAANAQSTKRLLDQTIQSINRTCPMSLDDDTVLKSTYLSGPYLVFDCIFNEHEVDIPTASKHKKEIQKVFEKMLEEMAHREDTVALLQLIAANNKGLEFRLTGNNTEKVLELKFSASEIERISGYNSKIY